MTDFNNASIEAEVEGLTQKQISVLILKEARRTNGRLTQLESTVYGDDSHGVDGLVGQVKANSAFRNRWALPAGVGSLGGLAAYLLANWPK